jgi:hypothetical protein
MIHDEAGSKGLAHLVTLFGHAATTTLAAEESVEEILKVLVGPLAALVAVIITATWGNSGLRAVRGSAVRVRIFLRRKGLCIDVHHRRADILGNLGKCGRQGDRIGNLQRGGVGAIGLGFISANTVDCNRPNQNAG